jgi:hypothetical protein
MTSHVLHAPRTIGLDARRLMCFALGVAALALLIAALAASGGPRTPPGTVHDGEAGAVPPGSGISFGRAAVSGYEPNLLPK